MWVSLLSVILFACNARKVQAPEGGNPLGSCVITEATGEVPSDLYQNTGVIESSEYAPFTKVLTVNGISLLGRDDNSDQFMQQVGETIAEMFATDVAGIDLSTQETMIRHMYERNTAIPLFVGDDGFDLSGPDEDQFDSLQEQNSICDVIYEYGGDGQTMEVVEHILHHVSMVGLHYTFPNEWGVTQDSLLYQYMIEAQDNDYYNHNYNQLGNQTEGTRIALQEYAYWVISTGWDIQAQYGGDGGGGEWTLQNPEDFQSQQAGMYSVFQETIELVMVSPSNETLGGFE